jgi:hypothetical protein
MDGSWTQIGLPALIAGVFGITTAYVTAKLSAKAERRRFHRDAAAKIEGWEREFAARYAELVSTNPKHAEAVREQFAKAYLHVPNTDLGGAADRFFIPPGIEMTVGNQPSCGIVILDSSISGRHSIIRMEKNEFWVQDLGTGSGTWVNGNKIDRCRLSDGDLIRFGTVDTSFKLLQR